MHLQPSSTLPRTGRLHTWSRGTTCSNPSGQCLGRAAVLCGKSQERPIIKTISACVANQSIGPSSPDLTLSTEAVASQAYQNSVRPGSIRIWFAGHFSTAAVPSFRPCCQPGLRANLGFSLGCHPGPISPIGCLRLYREKSPGGARRDSGLDHVSVIGDCMIDCHLDGL